MIKFRDWLATRESSAFTRRRKAAYWGLAPNLPDASLHSRSTWPYGKKHKKKKSKSKNKKK